MLSSEYPDTSKQHDTNYRRDYDAESTQNHVNLETVKCPYFKGPGKVLQKVLQVNIGFTLESSEVRGTGGGEWP